MNKTYKLIHKVYFILASVIFALGLISVITAFVVIGKTDESTFLTRPEIITLRKTLLIAGFAAGVIAALVLFIINKLKVEMSNKEQGGFRLYLFAVLACILATPLGVVSFMMISKREEVVEEEVDDKNTLKTAEPESFPEINEGLDENRNVVVRLVSPRKRNQRPYKVTGIEDTASKNNWKGWIYLFPVIVLIAVFLLYPLINTIFISFAKNYKYATGKFDGLTLDNFGVIFGITKINDALEQNFVKYAIPNTILLTFVTVPIAIALALIISVALNSLKWFQKVLQTVFFLPYVTNAVAIGLVFSVIFDKSGVINFIFNSNTAWIYAAKRETAMIPLCIYIVWHSLPFKILILLSGLQGIDKQYYQAAQIDSCSKIKVLGRITIPLLSPQILYIMITSFIAAFKEYTSVVAIFNGPGTMGQNSVIPNMETIVYYVYSNTSSQNTSWAAAAAVFLFIIILLFTFVQFRVSAKRVHY